MVCATATTHPPAANASVYRPRRPAGTILHQVMRENLETYLVGGDQTCELGANVPFHVEATYRQYLKCGILAHGIARVYCANCGQPMRIIAFILDPPVIERILTHVGEPTEPPALLPARSPPQGELAFDQDGGRADWPEMDQSLDMPGDSWG